MYILGMDPLLDNLRIEVHIASQGRLTSQWRASDNRQPYARLYHVLGGSGYMYHHGQRYDLAAGQLYIIPALTPLTYACDDLLDIQWTHFNARLRNGLDLFHYMDCDYQVANREPTYYSGQFARLLHVLAAPGPARDLCTTGIMLQLLAPFVASADPEHQSRRQHQMMRFQRVLDYIDRHLAASIRLSELASLANLEQTYFSSLFAEYFGVPPVRYIHQRRIERALTLLWTTDHTLGQIAETLGYTDAFHFSRTFKRITAISPSDFRRRRHAPTP